MSLYLGTVRRDSGQDNQRLACESKIRDGKVKTKDDFSNLNFIIIHVHSVHLQRRLLCFFVSFWSSSAAFVVVVLNMTSQFRFLGTTRTEVVKETSSVGSNCQEAGGATGSERG